jgi:hypothetical protein
MLSQSFAQSDRFSQLTETNITAYAKPLVTTIGVGINSGSFYTAAVPELFGFSISFRVMLISIPNDQLTYTPTLPAGYATSPPAPTFWGAKGGQSYLGPGGYISMPGGINETSMPFGVPQITFSLLGTEALLRFVPTIKAGSEDFSFLGIGVKHSISRYIPLVPLDIAVQVMYNKFKLSSIVEGTNIAVNAEASKTFGLFTAYGGLQWESSKFDFNYTFKGDPNSGDPTLRANKNISASITGDDSFRLILGGNIKLAVVVINIDINLCAQTEFTTGLSFEF